MEEKEQGGMIPRQASIESQNSPEHRETPRTAVFTVISNILSAVFSPLLVPTIGYAIVLWTTYMSILPEKARLISCGIIFLITCIVPMGVIIFMIRKGLVSDAAISKQSERRIPYMVTTLCYFVAAFYLFRLPGWLPMFFVGAGITAIINSLVNIKWKISAHATAMGGLCAMLLYIGFNHLAVVQILPWILGAIFFSGAVGSARLYLGRHTPAQVYAGWTVGLAVTYTLMII